MPFCATSHKIWSNSNVLKYYIPKENCAVARQSGWLPHSSSPFLSIASSNLASMGGEVSGSENCSVKSSRQKPGGERRESHQRSKKCFLFFLSRVTALSCDEIVTYLSCKSGLKTPVTQWRQDKALTCNNDTVHTVRHQLTQSRLALTSAGLKLLHTVLNSS